MNPNNKNKHSSRDQKRLERDNKTVVVMAQLYCHDHHCGLQDEDGLCPECRDVVLYAIERTERCPQLHKGVCELCSIQCYKPAMRQQIRTIMAYSGPRMITHHPIMVFRHVAKKLSLKFKKVQ